MKIIVKETKRILDGFFKVDRSIVQYEKFDGSMSKETVRLNLDRGDSVAALLVNRNKQIVILVKQFRFPVYTKDQRQAWPLEIVAGVVDNNDSPQETISREIGEETGYHPKEIKHLFNFYPSPGGTNEKIYLYYAEVTKDDQIDSGGGVDSENEDILVVELSINEAFEMLDTGNIIDGKTIIALQWLKSRMQIND